MKTIRHLAWILLLPAALASGAPPEQPHAPGIESGDYDWARRSPELEAALARTGDPEAGRLAYEFCQGCHRSDASGRPDGTYPQLAGQHVTVLIKQMIDIRDGRRDNPVMFPFIGKHLIDAQEVSDIAAYLGSLPVPKDNGKGPGDALERGRELYERDCQVCHGPNGEGDADELYPLLAGQHYRYLLRQIGWVQDGTRRNANPKMVEALKDYNANDMEAVADHLSQLRSPCRR